MVEQSSASVAHHEAGHAVVGLVRDLDVYHLTIIPDYDGDAAGAILCDNDWRAMSLSKGEGGGLDDKDLALAFQWGEGRALSLLAGVTAEQMFTGEWQMERAENDMDRLIEWVEFSYLQPEPDGDEPPLYAPPFVWAEDDDGLVPDLVDQAWDRWGDECREILTANWAWVEAIAQAALDGDGNLTGEEMRALRC